MEEIDKDKLPTHIAIIMDGNGRWAKKKLLNRISGHIRGADAVREVVTACRELGIKVLTLYALSTENLRRPKDEVTALIGLLKKYLLKEREEMIENNIRLCAIGRLEDLPSDVRGTLQETIKKTEHCDGMILNLALSYGGRAEILHAAKGIISDLREGKMKPEELTDQRGISDFQFPSLADCLHGVICDRNPLAGLQSGGASEGDCGLSIEGEEVRPHQRATKRVIRMDRMRIAECRMRDKIPKSAI
jgi:undecaprenyl diphosphate synthase